MKKIFIDLGGNKGQSIKLFLERYPNAKDFEIHTFEPNPILWDILKEFPAILHKEVAWIYDGEIDFYVAKRSEGSTVVRGKITAKVDYDNPKRFPCIDFGKWISQFKDDFILLKINIEGAEYPILEHMIKDGSIRYIDELYVQFHDIHKIEGITEKDTARIMELLKDNGLKPKKWSKRFSLFKDYL